MRARSRTRYLRAAAARNVIFNPEWVSSTSISKVSTILYPEWILPLCDKFSLQCSLSRSNRPPHMLSGLTAQLLALSNQVKWPCLYADLQLHTAVYSHLVYFADTVLLWADTSKRRSVSVSAKPRFGHLYVTHQFQHWSFTDRWLMLPD